MGVTHPPSKILPLGVVFSIVTIPLVLILSIHADFFLKVRPRDVHFICPRETLPPSVSTLETRFPALWRWSTCHVLEVPVVALLAQNAARILVLGGVGVEWLAGWFDCWFHLNSQEGQFLQTAPPGHHAHLLSQILIFEVAQEEILYGDLCQGGATSCGKLLKPVAIS